MRTEYNNSKKTGGIYAAIILCLAAVLVLTYFSARSIFDKIPEDEWSDAADSAAKNAEKDKADDDTIVPTVKPEDKVTAGSSSKPKEEASSKAKSVSKDKQSVMYTMPLNGNINVKFSKDTPVFSKTMEDWRIHSGIDIKAKLGDSVKASADGKVEDIYTDELKGVTVVIAHADNVKSIYCGLDKNVNIRKDANVQAGDIIGKVGDTNEFESLDEAHLHFEMLKNGIYLNPEEMIK